MTNPIKNFSYEAYPKGPITQFFGENKDLYSTVCAAPNLCLTGGHNGVDIVDVWGTPIYCVMGGVVGEVKDSSTGYGKHVRIICDIGENYLEWTYGHLSRIDVTVGQTLAEGEQIGLMGNTGFVVSGATPYWKYNPTGGTHLHLGVREARKKAPNEPHTISWPNGYCGDILNYMNGFLGSIDPYPFFNSVPPTYTPSSLNAGLISQINALYQKLQQLMKK